MRSLRWDVVPYQTFTDTFNVGVVAFDSAGIDHVSFSVNGGAWTDVSTMSVNPTTNVNEYWATLKASNLNDGPLEVRAIAYPKVGVPRVLQGATDSGNGEVSMFLNANAGGTLTNLVRYVSPTGDDANDGLTAQTPKLHHERGRVIASPITSPTAGRSICHGGDLYAVLSAVWNTNSSTTNQWMTVTAAPGVDRSQVIIAGTTGSGFNSKLVRI